MYSSTSPLALPTPTSTTSRRAQPPAAPKLRDSCHCCASAKVRCGKEKPICSRCARRGLSCEYMVTRRAGRPHDKRTSNAGPNGTNSPPGVADGGSNREQGFSASALVDSPSQNTSRPTSSLFRSSAILFPTTPTDNQAEELSTMIPPPIISAVDAPSPRQSDLFSTNAESINDGFAALLDAFPGYEEALYDIAGLEEPFSPQGVLDSGDTLLDAEKSAPIHQSASKSSCIDQALAMMSNLSSHIPADCTTYGIQAGKETHSPPTIQTVIWENKSTIESLEKMLRCSCSQDSYLLNIISLIIFRVLGWYTEAAHLTDDIGHESLSSGSGRRELVAHEPGNVNDYQLGGDDGHRMAAQLVLSELHRAQRVIQQFVEKTKIPVTERGDSQRPPDCHPTGGTVDSEGSSPFSDRVLTQLGEEAGRRLRALSARIIDRLKGT